MRGELVFITCGATVAVGALVLGAAAAYASPAPVLSRSVSSAASLVVPAGYQPASFAGEVAPSASGTVSVVPHPAIDLTTTTVDTPSVKSSDTPSTPPADASGAPPTGGPGTPPTDPPKGGPGLPGGPGAGGIGGPQAGGPSGHGGSNSGNDVNNKGTGSNKGKGKSGSNDGNDIKNKGTGANKDKDKPAH